MTLKGELDLIIELDMVKDFFNYNNMECKDD